MVEPPQGRCLFILQVWLCAGHLSLLQPLLSSHILPQTFRGWCSRLVICHVCLHFLQRYHNNFAKSCHYLLISLDLLQFFSELPPFLGGKLFFQPEKCGNRILDKWYLICKGIWPLIEDVSYISSLKFKCLFDLSYKQLFT